jgi:hypothetical protein
VGTGKTCTKTNPKILTDEKIHFTFDATSTSIGYGRFGTGLVR